MQHGEEYVNRSALLRRGLMKDSQPNDDQENTHIHLMENINQSWTPSQRIDEGQSTQWGSGKHPYPLDGEHQSILDSFAEDWWRTVNPMIIRETPMYHVVEKVSPNKTKPIQAWRTKFKRAELSNKACNSFFWFNKHTSIVQLEIIYKHYKYPAPLYIILFLGSPHRPKCIAFFIQMQYRLSTSPTAIFKKMFKVNVYTLQDVEKYKLDVVQNYCYAVARVWVRILRIPIVLLQILTIPIVLLQIWGFLLCYFRYWRFILCYLKIMFACKSIECFTSAIKKHTSDCCSISLNPYTGWPLYLRHKNPGVFQEFLRSFSTN